MAPTSIGKSFSSSYASHYRFVLCQTGGFIENQRCPRLIAEDRF
jgi:hypothetical protein